MAARAERTRERESERERESSRSPVPSSRGISDMSDNDATPRTEKAQEAPAAVAAAEHPPAHCGEQKPARFMRNNLVTQSGVPNVQAWEVHGNLAF